MSVMVTFSNVSAGSSMTDTQDSGDIIPGGDSEAIDIYIRHDGAHEITDCAWYLTECQSDLYSGVDPTQDLLEVLGWGDNTIDGGFKISQVNPFDTWDTFSSSLGTINNQISLPGDAEIDPAEEIHVKVKWTVPDPLPENTSAGQRGVTLVFAYSATS